jgi:SAM-dependent methyltransferase
MNPSALDGPDIAADYYAGHGLEGDRIALWYYARVTRRLAPAGGRVLDFGCGTGHLLRRLSRTFDAFGYDTNSPARSQCRVTAPDAVVLEEWQSLEPESFDAIVSLHTLEHIEKPGNTIEALTSKLVPGGALLFVVPNPSGWGHQLKKGGWFAHRDQTHCSLLSQGAWLTLARRAGLQIAWVRGDGMWDAPYTRGLPTALQRALFGAPAALQLASPIARPFLPPVLGECLIVAARRPSTP